MEKKYDSKGREITKISRECEKLVIQMMKETGVGSAEFDLIHLVRHHPGISQKEISKELNMDKGAVAKRVKNLEEKGYLKRVVNPDDHRSALIYASDEAQQLKYSKTYVETFFYEWLLEGISHEDKETFISILDVLYNRSKKESRSGFPHVKKMLQENKYEE